MDVDIQPDYIPSSEEYDLQCKYETMIDNVCTTIHDNCKSVIQSIDCGEEVGDWIGNAARTAKLQLSNIMSHIPASCTLKCDYFENAVACFEKATSMLIIMEEGGDLNPNVVSVAFITARMYAYRTITGLDEE